MNSATITQTLPGYGTTTITAVALDMAIMNYLPASPNQLAQIIADRTGDALVDVKKYTNCCVSTMLIMLADFDYNTSEYEGTVFAV